LPEQLWGVARTFPFGVCLKYASHHFSLSSSWLHFSQLHVGVALVLSIPTAIRNKPLQQNTKHQLQREYKLNNVFQQAIKRSMTIKAFQQGQKL
jgi:ABC-type bacteriocin/lantibiotic exporter with double-glycine peptidase domain